MKVEHKCHAGKLTFEFQPTQLEGHWRRILQNAGVADAQIAELCDRTVKTFEEGLLVIVFHLEILSLESMGKALTIYDPDTVRKILPKLRKMRKLIEETWIGETRGRFSRLELVKAEAQAREKLLSSGKAITDENMAEELGIEPRSYQRRKQRRRQNNG